MLGPIFLFLALGSVALMFVGLLFPRLVLRSGVKSRGRVVRRYGSYFAIFLGATIFFAGRSEESRGNETAAESMASVPMTEAREGGAVSDSVVAGIQKTALAAQAVTSTSGDKASASELSDENAQAIAEMQRDHNEEARVKAMLQKAAGSSVTVNVVNKEKGKFRVVASYEPEAVWSESFFVKGLAIGAEDLAKAMNKGGVAVDGIMVVGYGKYVDRYGNESRKKVMTLEIPGVDHEKANWSNMTLWGVLNLSEVTLRPVGRSTAKSFCDDGENAKEADLFCSAVRSGTPKKALSQITSSHPSDSRNDASASNSDEAGMGSERVSGRMDLDFGTFVKRVNKDLKTAKYPRALSSNVRPESSGGQMRSARFDLSDGLSALVMTDDKTDKLTRIVTIITPSEDHGENIANATAAVLVVSAPAGRDGEKIVGGPIMRMYSDVMQKFLKSVETESDSFVRSGVRYGVHIGKLTGIMVYAEAASGT